MIDDPGAATELAAGLADAKAYLRIESDDDDALITGLIGTAAATCEAFLAQALIVRSFRETITAHVQWRRLQRMPVRAIEGIDGLPAEGAAFVLPSEAYGIDIDADGDGWVRIMVPGAAGRAIVRYDAGMANSWSTLPEMIRQGIIRLVAHLYTHRDGAIDGAPPIAIVALWQPWRRMRLK